MSSTVEDSVSYPWGTVWVDKDHGICRVRFVEGLHQTLQVTVEEIQAVGKVTGGRPLPLLVDLRPVKATDFDARRYLGSAESKARWRSAALLTGTPLSNAIGNLWLARHNSKENPVKMFTVEAEAIAWLKKFL
jgi:predicted metalloendopeptidase